jgi:type VI secretion system protein ImpA
MAALLEDLDVEAVLAPIPGDAPTGVDLRQDYAPTSVYFRLRDARAEARDAERQAESSGGDDVLPTHWRTVQSLALKALTESAKDLEAATWLTEALVRTAGLRGLATGAAVITGLVERYWDDLFPMPDEDGMETRVGPVAGLAGQGYDGTLMQPLRKLTLFRRADGTPFGFWQYQATVELAGITDSARRAQRIEAGVVPYDDVEKEARLAGGGHWAAQRREIAGAMEYWAQMSAALDAKAADASPSTTRVRELLQSMLEICDRFGPAPDQPAAESVDPAAATDGASEHAGAAGGARATNGAPGPIVGREQALRQLGEIAAWFKRNEPHSPLAYTLDEAVRRGRMSWPDLVAELLPDETTRNALLTSLGIKPPAPEE